MSKSSYIIPLSGSFLKPLAYLKILVCASKLNSLIIISFCVVGNCTEVSLILLPSCVTPLVVLPSRFTLSLSKLSWLFKAFCIFTRICSSVATGLICAFLIPLSIPVTLYSATFFCSLICVRSFLAVTFELFLNIAAFSFASICLSIKSTCLAVSSVKPNSFNLPASLSNLPASSAATWLKPGVPVPPVSISNSFAIFNASCSEPGPPPVIIFLGNICPSAKSVGTLAADSAFAKKSCLRSSNFLIVLVFLKLVFVSMVSSKSIVSAILNSMLSKELRPLSIMSSFCKFHASSPYVP